MSKICAVDATYHSNKQRQFPTQTIFKYFSQPHKKDSSPGSEDGDSPPPPNHLQTASKIGICDSVARQC